MQFNKLRFGIDHAIALSGPSWGCLQVVAPGYGTFRGHSDRRKGGRLLSRVRSIGARTERSFLPRSLPQWIEIPEHFSSSLPPSLAQGRFAAFVLPIEALADPILTCAAGACTGVVTSAR